MSLTSEIEEVIAEKSRSLPQDSELKKLSDFYERMKKAGLVKAPKYDLPQVDTIGRAALRSSRARNSRSETSR